MVVLGHTGSITFDAIRWLADIGAGYVQVDEDGRVLAAFGPQGTDRPPVRRAQADALDTAWGIVIARELIHRKLDEQVRTLRDLEQVLRVDPSAWAAIELAQGRLRIAATRDDIRMAEAAAAAAYWGPGRRWSSAGRVGTPTGCRHTGARSGHERRR